MASAAILAGGRARRLEGADKGALEVGGTTIRARQIRALRAAGIEHIVLVGRATVEHRQPLPVIADAVPDRGALGGLYTALLAATDDVVVVLASDMPFVTPDAVRQLMAIGDSCDVVVPRTADGLHPLCAAYRRRVARSIKRRLDTGDLSVRAALTDMRTREITGDELRALDPDETMLINVNTPADYERARGAAAAIRPHA